MARRFCTLALALSASCGRGGFDAFVDARSGDANIAPGDVADVEVAVPVIVDAFEDGTIDAPWFPYEDTANPNGTRIAEAAGELQLTTAQNFAESYAGLTTTMLDLTGKAFWIELAAAPPSMPGATTYMAWNNAEHGAQFRSANGAVFVSVNAIDVATFTDPYPAARWWRIRESAGHLLFEVAADGRAWTEVHRVAAAVHVNGAINLGGGAFSVHPGGELFRIAGIGVAPP